MQTVLQSPWDDVTAEGEVGLGLVPERAVAGEAACVAAGEAVWHCQVFPSAYVVSHKALTIMRTSGQHVLRAYVHTAACLSVLDSSMRNSQYAVYIQ
jgi:nitroimidazol reductase NimA-like FMN-containing flavoprotein (pyridoxamine 5'-phosphate oxidase superfamily)